MSLLRRNFSPLNIYRPAPPDAADPDCDVVLVQGFLTTPAAVRPLRQRLEEHGLTCAIPPLGGLRGGYQTNRVARSAEALTGWLADRPAHRPPPWIVGHSMGGIIARHAIQHLDLAAAGLVTLGSPHHGTPTAWLGMLLGPVTRAPFDLMPLNRRIRRLNRQPWPEHVPLLSISGGADLLCPPPFGRLPVSGPRVRSRHLRRVGHTELLASDTVLTELIATLGG